MSKRGEEMGDDVSDSLERSGICSSDFYGGSADTTLT